MGVGAVATDFARRLADMLGADKVLYPALETSVGHAFWKRDFAGASGLFTLKIEGIDRDRLDKAIDMADLREFIDSLPQGVDTPAGECGNRLSGGQRQRIGIARALYKEAEILFFDEATSSLDNDTEQNINNAIEQLSKHNKELTIIVIAHRESSLDYCDRILTLEANE